MSRRLAVPLEQSYPAVRALAVLVLLVAVLSGCLFKGKAADAGGASGPVTIEYVPIAIAWVKRHVPATPADISAWAATPAGKAASQGEIRHVLVAIDAPRSPQVVAAARKRAEALVARVARGEDVAALAREASDDEATREVGGALGADAAKLPEPLRTVARQLGPGELAGDPVRGARGWHVVMRDPMNDAALAKAYRKDRAPTVARKLADEVLARMQSEGADSPAEAIFKDGVAAVLGAAAADDPKRHPSERVSPAAAARADLPPDAREALAVFARKAKPGDVVDSPLGTGPVLVVARAVASR